MKIIKREQQQQSFKQLIEIIKVLATIDSRDATEAIIDAFDLAEALGVLGDLERVAGQEEPDYKQWTKKFCVLSAYENRRSVRRVEE
ncbi:MAG: hypothetical protein IJI87_00480 [Mogibacterium sp.]|nr:hypothetical protein [Mogibacterium sp.]